MPGAKAVWRFLRSQPFALVGIGIYALFIVLAIFADQIATHDPRQILFSGAYRVARYLPPSATHYLGTTAGGRDIFSQLVHGTRSALTVGVTAAFCVVVLGSLMGLLAGYLGGWVDRIIMRVSDIVLGLPFLPFILVISALTRPGTTTLVASVALLLWPNTARVIRSQVLSLRERGWVEAARVTGCSPMRIIFVHIAPQVAPLAALYGSIAVGWAILTEASASFLGFGDPAAISWGLMLQDAFANQALSREAWNWFIPPGLCIVALVLAGFLVSRGSEKLLFPKLGD
ncbi:ABC transporter permease [Falsiroseomonas stagni]|uniref:Peptide/nickel transport system permease protein n=1 Tax=Falsiroseomonas stagni DSM 19981 TaxID=1123062 RepID=A0A1I3XWU5_9PROT|nr:ABC transporter permease [Falsiroseomonas stagni]SFK23972.1 peptide/nickel transport system permease protein [Falsiroseomonas stagni DSM 19981]